MLREAFARSEEWTRHGAIDALNDGCGAWGTVAELDYKAYGV